MKKAPHHYQVTLEEDISGRWFLILERIQKGTDTGCVVFSVNYHIVALREMAKDCARLFGPRTVFVEVPFEQMQENEINRCKESISYLTNKISNNILEPQERATSEELLTIYRDKLDEAVNWVRRSSLAQTP